MVLSYVFDRLLLLHGFEVGGAAVHAVHGAHTAHHTRKRHVDNRVCEKSERRCCVNVETVWRSGFLVATKQRMGNFWGNARSRDAASPKRAGSAIAIRILHVKDVVEPLE